MLNDLARKLDDQSRRQFMLDTARACLGVSVIGGINWATNLAAHAAGDTTSAAPAPRSKPAKSVIYLFLSGGMSHLDTWDPKPGTDVAGEFKPIKTAAGIQISDKLPLIAKQLDKACIIRSMTSSQGAHERAQYLMHTSYAPLASIKHPGIGPWLNKLGPQLSTKLPGSVVVGGDTRYSGAGIFGSAYEPIVIGNPQAGLQNSKMRVAAADFDHRRSLLDQLDQSFRQRYPQESVQAYNRFYQEAVELMKSTDVKAFDIAQESADVKSAYGASNFGMGCLLARRLVEEGVRYVEVNLGGWDTHQDNFEELSEKLPVIDQAISALLSDLAKRGMLDSTLVVQTSEFGRTPKINERDGRDHYPKCFSCMLAGGGVKGGQIYGASDDKAAAVKDKPVTPQDLNATIAYALGIPHNKQIFSKIGRPFTLADEGKPVAAIF